MTVPSTSPVQLRPVLRPATVEILSATCEANGADATVTFILKITRTTEESLENQTAKIGETEATLTECTTSPTEGPTGVWTHIFDGTIEGVTCDETHTIKAEATVSIVEKAADVNVTCPPCEGETSSRKC